MDYALLLSNFDRNHGHHSWPRQRLLHECLRHAIRDGTLAAGTRLVATRALAAELGVARNTVLYAYEQLASEGFVVPDRRGTVVARVSPAPVPEAGPGLGQKRRGPPPAGPAGLSRRAMNLRPLSNGASDAQAFVPGVPDLHAFPLALWRRLLDRAWRGLDAAQLNYGDPAGAWALRTAIADYLRASRGVVCEAEQVFITDGSQSTLDLCARACADEGDTVWHENPGYGGALAAFRHAGLAVAGIPVDEDGMAPSAQDWKARRPALIYTTPSHQYPVGTVLSLARRLALIDGARRAGALIIEDDYDSEFRHDGPPLAAMQGLAADAPVLYCGTFSKTMFPGLRIGYLVVPPGLAPQLALLRAQSAAAGRVAEQLALAEFVTSGQFLLHLRRMRRLYRERRDALVAALEKHLGRIATVHGASAGMHLSLRLPDWLPDEAIRDRARQEGIVVNALSTHAVQDGAAWNGLMLGYAQVPAAVMDGLVKRLAAVIHLAAYEAGRVSATAKKNRSRLPFKGA
ncbi:MocR-like pyridoxine biosynthesis transcription factor PdxR [Pseudoduganella umbonata]|uniref:GntR family transcriptional regulator/MocR family aminotransferase n=1 Tax=Pseudoduganella umbonata TaxID=864828 RepID=A0A4P8HVM6_9BURK|nr:PLP-dependent aminotransferase family protein [Pseudoduganella umbonata]MBB3225309.1 GntR family transcriptional regulator/MocR family aminotransferase [Pseudoduganella umbonata]QCP12902.1 PLP-dependent aminotransferase family protein [Pseudoduganella umbonata]